MSRVCRAERLGVGGFFLWVNGEGCRMQREKRKGCWMAWKAHTSSLGTYDRENHPLEEVPTVCLEVAQI